MQAFISNKETQKLLKTYLLRSAYQVVRSLDKQLASSLASCCIIIRKNKIKNQTEFGYKQSLKTGLIKKIHFVYLSNVTDLVTFLWAHLSSEVPLTAGIFIDSIQQYFGERFDFQEKGRTIPICMNLLSLISEKTIGIKKQKMKIAFSLCFNAYVFQKNNFVSFMESSKIIYWEITHKEILKNGHDYESDWTKAFLQQYSHPSVKQQAE